ncbi:MULTISPECIES: hypothetical protein [Vibrio harveyi group]|uniref:hypothetical protein n=1 Tax=Vibrio harveyi group TaxID=717610 RepID=UPI00211B0FC5|nr:hypothetical protein [Vibrio alginolyticus]MCG6280773.1 hypothetical protein [Vibrio diabolicus]MCS0294286.1 hypothetical protein [Vibrio alginolyticus]
MKIVKSLIDAEQLELPLPIKEQLMHQLLLPWSGDRDEAEKFWKEVSTCLILIERSDTDQDLADVDEDTEVILSYAIENPEFVILLPDETEPYVFACCVHADDGSGSFVMGSTSNTTQAMKTLIELAE